MKSENDFWISLNRLADAYANRGLTASERAASVLSQFEEMPPLAQREVLEALRGLAYQLPDLYTVIAARVYSREIARNQQIEASQKAG
jgi:hypothetical protein